MKHLVSAALIVLLAGCGQTGESGTVSGTANEERGEQTEDAGTPVTLLESGFGQVDASTHASVIVRIGEQAVGEYVTASVNFRDSSGELIGTEEQVEQARWEGQELVLPVNFYQDSKPVKIAKIEVTVSSSDYGDGAESREPLPKVKSSSVVKGDYGVTAKFELTNPLDKPLTDVRVGVTCYNSKDKIVGGGYDFPELIAAGGEHLSKVDVTVSGTPEYCTAAMNYGD